MTAPSLDVIRLIVPRLTLWDARSMQLAHPAFAELVHERVECTVREAMSSERPRCIDAFLKCPRAFKALVHGRFTFEKCPLSCRLHYGYGGFVVYCCASRTQRTAVIELRTTDPTCRPTFETLGNVVAAVTWFRDALEARGVETRIQTRAATHRPVSEVLNGVLERVANKMLRTNTKGVQQLTTACYSKQPFIILDV